MKPCVLWYIITFLSLNGLNHANYISALHGRFKRTGETTTQSGLESKDKKSLQEALQILNMGKLSLNLPTEDTQLLLQLVDVSSNDTDKSDQIEKFVEGPSSNQFSSNGKEYLALSGDNKRVHVDNFSIVTPAPEEGSTNNNVEVEDVFKMVVRKKDPDAKDNALRKISIVETNRMEPLERMEYPQSKRKRKDAWYMIDSLSRPRVRKKRTKRHDNPLLRFIRGDFSANVIDDIFAERGTRGQHLIKIDNNSEKDKVFGNNRMSKREFDDRDDIRNEFHETPSWKRSHHRLEFLPWKDFRTEPFHGKRHANKIRFHAHLDYLPSSNLQVWSHPLKSISPMDDQYVDDVLKVGDSDKSVDMEKALGYEGLRPYFETQKPPIFSRNKPTRTRHLTKHSLIKKNISSESPNSSTSPQSYTTERGTTLQHEKIGLVSNIVMDKYALEKSMIFPSENTIKETKSTGIMEVAIVVFIDVLCFAAVILVCSLAVRWHRHTTCCNSLELKDPHVTVNIHENFYHDPTMPLLPYRSLNRVYYRQKMALQEKDEQYELDLLPDLEWETETNEWLTDKGSVREGTTFEQLL